MQSTGDLQRAIYIERHALHHAQILMHATKMKMHQASCQLNRA